MEGAGRPPPTPGLHAKTRAAVLSPLLQKVPPGSGTGQNPLILRHTAAIHSTWTGITPRPGCLATISSSHPPPADQVGKAEAHPRAAVPNSGCLSISCSPERAGLHGSQNNPFGAVTPEEPMLKSVAVTKRWTVKGP